MLMDVCKLVVLLSVLAGISFLSPGQSKALDLSAGEVEVNLDTTISYGMTVRVEKPDDALIREPGQLNDNDGNSNYKRGIVSNAAKFTSDFDLGYRNIGLFLRASGFFDHENEEGTRADKPLTPAAKRLVGKDLDLLDAYVTGDFELDPVTVSLRLGKHVLNWGESTFIQNGINAINPFDVSKLRVPGAELREALVAVPLVSAAVELPANLSVEGFYQLDWRETEIDPVGTYFSTTDYVGPGATRAFLNDPRLNMALEGNPLPNSPRLGDDPDFLAVRRGPDRNPKDAGQWGVALRYLAEELNSTEFGFYAINYHSRLPTVRAHTGTAAAAGAGLAATGMKTGEFLTTIQALNPAFTPQQAQGLAAPYGVDAYARTGNYFIEYPEDIRLYGLSFNTQLGGSGWALQGEYSLRDDAPLQIEEATLIATGLAPFTGLGACIAGKVPTLVATGLSPQAAQGQAGLACIGENAAAGLYDADVEGYIRRRVSQFQATATRVFGPVLGADGFVFLAEAAVLKIHDMPAKSVLRLESPALGSPSDATSMGYRIATRLDYNNAFASTNLFPYLQFQHDFNGNSPQPIGPFVDGRTALTLGLRVDYLSRWEGGLSYTRYGGKRSEIRDRDFVTATVKYSF